jgi:CheY-like chemotaxis protein
MAKILLVEDEKILRDAYTILLESQDGYELDVAANGQEALDFCSKNTYDVILLDLMMPVLDGVGFLEKASLKQRSPSTRIVVMSNLSSGEALAKAIDLGIHRHAVKSDLSSAEVVALVQEELNT